MSISSVINADLIIPVISALINIWLAAKFSNNSQSGMVSPSRVVIIVRERIKEKTITRTGTNDADYASIMLAIAVLFMLAVAFFYSLYWSQILVAIKYVSLYSIGLFISVFMLYKKSAQWVIFAAAGVIISAIGWYGATHFVAAEIPTNITYYVEHDLRTSDGNFLEAIIKLPHSVNWNAILWMALQGIGSSLLFLVEFLQAIVITSVLIFEALNGNVPLLIMRFSRINLYKFYLIIFLFVFISYLLVSGKIYYSIERKNINSIINYWPY